MANELTLEEVDEIRQMHEDLATMHRRIADIMHTEKPRDEIWTALMDTRLSIGDAMMSLSQAI